MQVKQINVTEARANFATILSDTENHYVITKNNKPQRVIINFEDFEKLQGVTKRTEELAVDEPRSWEADKTKKTNPAGTQSIKGIIAQQFELSQHQAAEPAIENESFSFDKIKPLSPEEKSHRPDLITEADAMPFDLLEEMPPEREGFVAGELVVEGDYFQNAEESAETELETAVIASPALDETLEEVGEQQVCTGEIATRTPEEEEYFRRYRKLYESSGLVSAPQVLWETLPNPVRPHQREETDADDAEKILRQQEDAYQQMRSELDVAVVVNEAEREVFVVEPALASTTDFRGWDDSFAISSGAIAPQQELAADTLAQSQKKAGEGENLPSLQELLKELDKERLSGEEGDPLDNKDIDELISRITSD